MKMRARLRAGTADVASGGAIRRAETPHRALMVARFGRRAAHVPVFVGPAVAQQLGRKQAQGAAIDGAVFLPNEGADADLVAHELAHALQQPEAGGLADAPPAALLERLAHAPVLPEHSRAEAIAEQAADGAGSAPADLAAAPLPAGVAALRRTVPEGEATTAPAPVTPRADPPAPAPATSGPDNAAPAAVTPAAGEADIAPTFAPPEFAEPTIDPAVAAQRAAEAAAAQEAMAAAESPAGVMDAYSTMAPSQKALAMGGLQGRLEASNATANTKLAEATPAVSVATRGEDAALPLPAPITVPTDAPDITPADAAAPTVDVPAAPEQPTLSVPPTFNHEMERHFTESATPERVDDQIDAVSTRNPGIQTAVTERADVPRDGANDPARLDEAQQQQRDAASSQRQEAAAAVVNGPGPETIMPRALEAEVPAPAMQAAATPAITPAPEAAQLQALALPETVVADFDAATGAEMAASTAAAREQMQTAETDRQTAHDTAVSEAETSRADAERQADQEQRDAVTEHRQAIQDERQRTVDDQNTAMAEVNGQAARARDAKRTEAETEVRNAETQINARYDQAEADARAEVAEGERRAEAERERKRRESEEQSWWERAAGWIADAFEALVSLVNGIFDLVRSAITGLIDLARRAVTALIDLASRALQALVSALGDILKGLIDGLIGQIFPELAARLSAAIDRAVNAVNSAIDAVANRLIAGVNAIAAALTSAVNALLDAFQGAFNAAVAVLQAAISGDWGALLRQVLDAVLRVLGIDPAAFHALIAQATDAISIIVNDPGAFVGNMISALVGGVEKFRDNFGTHLRRGVIGWLTGALGDIQIPSEWTLWTVLDLVRQIMGLTWDFVRERAGRLIGPQNVARLEMMASWIGTLITEGWQGLWTRIQESLASLRDSVLESIRNFLMERVVMAAIGWLASLFNPVGALVKLVMTIWNIYQFVSAQLQRLMGIATAVVASISNIAHGVLDPAKQRVEEVLGNLVPVVIDLLMSLLGVTGVAARVRQIITDLRQSIANAVDRMLERVLTTLGLRRGSGDAAAAGAAGAGGAAAAQIGHPVRVDVAEGEDHTLSIDRTGPGGATVMLRSDPRPLGDWLTVLAARAETERNETKKATALRKIGEARTLLAELEPAADAIAAARPAGTTAAPATPRPAAAGGASAPSEATVVSKEERMGPILKEIFDNLSGAGDAFIEGHAADLARVHGDAANAIRLELRRDIGNYARNTDWAGVTAMLKRNYALLQQPFLATSAAFPTALRGAATAQIDAHKAEMARTPADDPGGARANAPTDRVLRELASGVRDGAPGVFGELYAATTRLIMTGNGQAVTTLNDLMKRAAAQATTEMARSAGTRDQALVTAIGNAGGIIPFLNNMAKNRSAGGMSESQLETAWTNQANLDYVKDLFRAAMPEQHEWIPSNFIPNVVRLASVATPAGQEAGETFALWVRVQHEWRTPTRSLIFKPEGNTRRAFTADVPQPDGTTRRLPVVILQGHSGAVYAPAEDGALTARPVPQTKGQPWWHDELRDRFVAGSTNDSKAGVQAIMEAVKTFTDTTVLQTREVSGVGTFSGYTSSTGAVTGLDEILTRAANAGTQIRADFARARAVLS